MIVSSMSYIEIRKEVDNDIVFVKKKSIHVIAELEKKMKKNKLKTITHIYDYNSPNKNKWLVKIEIGLKNVASSFLTYFYIDNKIAAVQVLDARYLLYYTTHFFKRYKERMNLDIAKPEELIRQYFSDSTNFVPQLLGVTENYLLKIFILCKHGAILGNIHTDSSICKMNTFITTDMLKTDQVEMENEMKERLRKYSNDTGRLD
jgi:hypothetical protein